MISFVVFLSILFSLFFVSGFEWALHVLISSKGLTTALCGQQFQGNPWKYKQKTKQNNKEIPILWCVGITTCFFCYCYYFIIILFPYYRTGLLSKHANASKQKAIYILSSFQSFLSSLCLTWIGKCTAQREYDDSLVLKKHKRCPPGSVVHCTSSFNR